MSQELSLHQRRRLPTRSELEGIPWLGLLQGEAHERALAALVVGDAQAGDYVCRLGRPVTVPNSFPLFRIRSPVSSKSSVGKGPEPTRVV